VESQATYSFGVCQADFDTKLYILDGNGELVACNDDGCISDPTHSYLELTNLVPGIYYVVVDGFGDNSGDYELVIQQTLNCEPVTCPDTALTEIEPNEGCSLGGIDPVFQEFELNTTVCANTWSDPIMRDTDWYRISLAEPGQVTVVVEPEAFNPIVALFPFDPDECYRTDIYYLMDEGGFCEDEILVTDILPAGEYLVFMANCCWCNNADGNYIITITFEPDVPTTLELVDFTAAVQNDAVLVSWEMSHEGEVSAYQLNRNGEELVNIAVGDGNYSYLDETVSAGNSYEYTLLALNRDGSTVVLNSESVTIPQAFALDQNYPNPFNPTTSISFQIPETGDVKLAVYNLAGIQVAELVNGTVQAGNHSVLFDASDLPSGMYFYSLTAGNLTATRKLMLLK
jgi:hypothetical protein